MKPAPTPANYNAAEREKGRHAGVAVGGPINGQFVVSLAPVFKAADYDDATHIAVPRATTPSDGDMPATVCTAKYYNHVIAMLENGGKYHFDIWYTQDMTPAKAVQRVFDTYRRAAELEDENWRLREELSDALEKIERAGDDA